MERACTRMYKSDEKSVITATVGVGRGHREMDFNAYNMRSDSVRYQQGKKEWMMVMRHVV